MSGDITPLNRRKKEANRDDPRDNLRDGDAASKGLRDPREGLGRDRKEERNTDGGEAFQVIDTVGLDGGASWRRRKHRQNLRRRARKR